MFLLIYSCSLVWLGLTFFIDFFLMPIVFRTISDLTIAGNLGILTFSAFNKIECVLGIISVASCGLFYKSLSQENRRKKKVALLALWGGVISLLMIVGTYIFFLTPTIIKFTPSIQYSEEAMKTHQLFHQAYVGLDSAKIVLLILVMIITFPRQNYLKKFQGKK